MSTATAAPAAAPSTAMSEHDVVTLMRGSRSEAEWNANCDAVKKSYNGSYPAFWFAAILASGLAGTVRAKFITQ